MKILHTADIHMGYETHGRLDPKTGRNTRLQDFKDAFDFMVARGLEEDIDLFLFAGDAYRTADPTPTQQQLFAEALRPISEAGIPIVMIVGNHDHPVSFGKSSSVDIFSHLAGEVHIFRRPETKVIETKAGALNLIALPWPIRSLILSKDEHRKKSSSEIKAFIEDLYVRFLDETLPDLEAGLPTVLTGHFTVQGASLSGSERTSVIGHEPVFTVGQLARSPIDYVALGHIHKFQDLNEGNIPPVVYSSSIERINFKEWQDPRGFVLVDIEAGNGKKTTQYEFIETPARRFIAIQLDVQGEADPTEAILKAIRKENIAGAVVRIRYQIEENRLHEVDIQQIRKALVPASSIAAIERKTDQTARERRTVVTRDLGIQEAMAQYIAQHDHLQTLEKEMLEATEELVAILESRQNP